VRRFGRINAFIAAFVLGWLIVWLFRSAAKPMDQVAEIGAVRQGERVTHTFKVHNRTLKPMTFVDYSAGCVCTVLDDIKGKTVWPLSSTKVRVQAQFPIRTGQTHARLSLKIKGRERPILLALRGTVEEEYPATIDFGALNRGDTPERSFQLRTFEGQPQLQIVDTSYDRRYFEVVVKADPSEPGQHSVRVQLKSDVPYGAIRSPLNIYTNDADIPIKSIALLGRVLRPLEVSEDTVVLGNLGSGGEISKTVVLSSPYGRPIHLGPIENSKEEYIVCETGEPGEDGSIEVLIACTAKLPPPGLFKATLRFHATVGGEKTSTRVEVYGVVPPRDDATAAEAEAARAAGGRETAQETVPH